MRENAGWQLGKITRAEIELEDHNILTFSLTFDFGGTGQSFCGYALDTWSEQDNRRVGTAAGCDLILQLLTMFGVSKWSEIKGRVAEVRRGDCGTIVEIRTPAFEGGRRFSIYDWQAHWLERDERDGEMP